MTTNREIFNDSFFEKMTAHLEGRGIDLEALTKPRLEDAPAGEVFEDSFFDRMTTHLESRGVDLERLTQPRDTNRA